MKEWVQELLGRPWVAHLRRAFERFGARLGSQFAAAISYFSILSMVPILMFAFSVLGWTLTVLRPDWLAQVHELITAIVPDGDLGPTIVSVVDEALGSWSTIGLVGLLAAGWSGAGWVANLKAAVRAVWRPESAPPSRPGNPALELARNLGILVAILVGVLATFAASTAATTLADLIFGVFGLDEAPGAGLLLRLLSLALSLITGFALFLFLYWVFPETSVDRTPLLRGAAAGSVGLALLQYAAGALFGVFGGNAAAALFGPVIVLMLFFNLFATLILLVAAWIATDEVPVEAPIAVVEAPAADEPDETDAPPAMVNQAVAQRAMGVGLGAGYALGAATGIGLGALIASAFTWIAGIGRR